MTWGAESQSAVYSAGNGSSRRALREKPANMNKKWPLGEHICTWRTFLYLENIFALKELICDRFSFHLSELKIELTESLINALSYK